MTRPWKVAIPLVRWRLLHSPPLDGPRNMALDHALMGRARRTGESVLRAYGWAAPVLSLGRNQRAIEVYDDAALARDGITVVRRPTGGRALLHHREVTYSVTAPLAADDGIGAAYQRVNVLLLHALGRLGVAASIAQPATRASLPTERPCFAEPSLGEIVVGGHKLIGSAQWRDDGALLQHGSILIEDDQARIPLVMRRPFAPSTSPATLRDALGRSPDPTEIAEALFESIRSCADRAATHLTSSEVEELAVTSLIDGYRDPAWTWRR